MADRSNYADRETTWQPHEHRLNFGNDSRAHTPNASENDRDGTYGKLAADASGDWSWKPLRDRALGYDTLFRKCKFATFLGVPKSGAEMFRGRHA